MNFTILTENNNLLQKLVRTVLNAILLLIRKISKIKIKSGENIVIIAFLRIGDTIFSIPAIKRIMKIHGQKIIVMCFVDSEILYKEVFTNITFINLKKSEFGLNGRIASSKARQKLKSVNPKIIYDLTCTITSATLIFNSKAEKIIGSNQLYYQNLYDEYNQKRITPHLINMYIDTTGIIHSDEKIEIKSKNLQDGESSVVLFHPFAGWKAKEWNLFKFIELIKKVSLYHPVKMIVPISKLKFEIVAELISSNIELIETESLSELINEIKRCFCFIGCDSGPLYIAHLFGKPTITLYGPTNPDYSKPFGAHNEVVDLKLECSPKKDNQYCFTFGGKFGCPAYQCFDLLQIEPVYKKVIRFLDNLKSKNIIIN